MVVRDPFLAESPLEPRRVKRRRIGGQIRTEQIDGHARMEVEVTLNRRQIDDA